MYKFIGRLLLISACVTSFWMCTHVDAGDAEIVIGFRDSDFSREYLASEVFDSVALVRLESRHECLISDVTKLIVKNGKIYVFDGQQNIVFRFDFDGRYIDKLHSVGRAKYEYLDLYDVVIAESGDVYLLHGDAKTISIYDNSFNFKERKQLDFYVDAFAQLRGELFAFNGSQREHRLFVYDIDKEIVLYSCFKYSEKTGGRLISPFVDSSGGVYFQKQHDHVIYNVTEEAVTSWAEMDYRNYSESELVDVGLWFVPPAYGADLGWLVDSGAWLYFQFQCEELGEAPYFVFSRKDDAGKVVLSEGNYCDDILHYPHPPLIKTSFGKDCFVGVLKPHIMLKYSTEEQLETIGLNDVDASDNPILAFYYMNGNICGE